MTIKTLIAAGVMVATASLAHAGPLSIADNGGTFDVLDPLGFDFDEDFENGAAGGTLTFTFENTSSSTTAVTLSSASITQSGSFGFFADGASVAWLGAGDVAVATQGITNSGQITFTIASGASDTLVLTYGDVTASNKTSEPNIDFTVQATEVPLPAGALLLGTALAGLGVARRRKKAA